MKARDRHPSASPPAAASALAGEDIARYLELFASQVGVSVRESDQPVATLAHCTLAVSQAAHEILACLRRTPGSPTLEARATIERNCVAVLERVQLAVVAIQFHDLLTQRLQHVGSGLSELAETLKGPRHDPEYWRALGERIRDRYTLHEQATLFDELVNGVTAPDEPAPADRPRVELF